MPQKKQTPDPHGVEVQRGQANEAPVRRHMIDDPWCGDSALQVLWGDEGGPWAGEGFAEDTILFSLQFILLADE